MRFSREVSAFGKSLLLVLVLLGASDCLAAVELPNVFGDHMVLQAGKPVRVWGWAEPGEKVAVRFGNQTRETTADAKGNWSTTLEAMKPSFEGRELLVTGKDGRVAIADVLVGEVWHCGGQSNMEWGLRAARDADMELASANFPAIRFLRLPHIARPRPQRDFPVESPTSTQGNWQLATTPQVENCTAVGYYFARRLQRQLNVPVGLIDTSWGGTMAQHWASRETLQSFPEMKPYFDDFGTKLREWEAGGGEQGARKRLEDDMKAWEEQMAQPRAEGERPPRRPNPDAYTSPATKRQPAGMFNGMLLPLAPYTVRGVLFYQGENNSFGESWKPFPKTFPAVIADWRRAIGDENLPFGIIQIAGWSNRRTMTYDMNHHTNIVREVQLNTWKTTLGTGLIATYDTNSNGSIHPGRKLPVGERAARWALAEVYGAKQWRSDRPLEWRGPVYRDIEIADGKITVSFEEGTARGLRLDQDDECGFYIAGSDREFHNARARVAGEQVVVWSDDVNEPVAVRYASSNLPVGRLMNGRELPAYPFRSDTWPLVPHQSTGAYEVSK